MRTADEVLDSLEEQTRQSGRPETFISGQLRLDAEFLKDLGWCSWRINGQTDSREQARRALEIARHHKDHPFSKSGLI